MIQPVRSIYFPGTAALEMLRERAHAALAAWAREWVRGWAVEANPVAALQVHADTDKARAHGDVYEAVPGAEGCAWFRRGSLDQIRLGRAVVGPDLMSAAEGVDDWIDTVIGRATDARNQALCAALLGVSTAGRLSDRPSPLPDSLFAVGSGAIVLTCEALGLHAIADNAVWRNVPPIERVHPRHRRKLTPLEEAARRTSFRLEVQLGAVEVDLPELLDLRCGDVLRLPQRLDRGMTVLCGRTPLARVTLGATHGRKCVQFVSELQS